MVKMKPLTVYKASAGSGKTFTLAVEYIKLLIVNPMNYRHILAVTFTNKATEEMKMRILSQLYGIWKQLPDSQSYMKRIVDETGFSEAIVSQRAGTALHLLLHNYNYFRVETIDTFFQSVLRNLARELDLTANLRISLNDVQVEEQAVDQLIDSLSHSDVLLQWIMKYIMETISDDRSWNVIGQVKQFGRTIFRDYYKEHSSQLTERVNKKGFLDAYMKQLREIKASAEKRMKEIAEEFFSTLEAESLTAEDLSYGKTGVYAFFVKLSNSQFDESIIGKRVTDCLGEPAKWYAKKSRCPEAVHALADTTLIPLLHRALEEQPRQWRLYQSAELTLRHLNQLRLLDSIERRVRQMNEDANRFLLSDTQQLLHALVKDSDSPFIFEKIGTQLEHVMIDEFQDTSNVQWQNFKVLLQECMSHVDTQNLIVGDVKQSIYRWRSGDWRLLNAIDREFPHSNDNVDIKPLDTNYRSDRKIIDFNNAFFVEAARQAYLEQQENYPQGAEQLKKAYADVRQQAPENSKSHGFIGITLLPQKDYQEQVLAMLVEQVRELVDKGKSPADIAILVRANSHIPLIADYFAEQLPEIHIVSDEAFRLDSSIAVGMLVQALHLVSHPEDILAKATLAKLYQRVVLGNQKAESDLLIKGRPLDSLLPEGFLDSHDEMLRMPLYELAEKIYRIFHLERIDNQSAYICAFYDQLNQFALDNSTDIDDFIGEWESSIGSKTIQSTGLNGLRILSIHKSKGLEFDSVLIPFCDWRLEHDDILWCKPTEPPFDALPIVPVNYSGKRMMGTVYEHDYLDEYLQNTVDNLNLLYVAFTRAERNLYVIGRRNAKGTRSALIESVLPALRLDGSTFNGKDDAEAPLTFTYGSLTPTPSSTTAKKSDNVFLKPVTPLSLNIETFDIKTEFRQSNKSRDFIEGDNEQEAVSYVKAGSVLHEIFSTIRTTADISQALLRLQHDGILYDDEVTREKITSMLRKRLEDKRFREWFSDRWTLFNECSILSLDADGNMKERRPDRVMTDGHETHVVDFKFGSPKAEYHEQVREYMTLLSSMGMPNVKGWLWYVYNNKVEEVRGKM